MIVSTSCLVCTQHLNVNTMIFDLFSAKWYKKIAKRLWLAHCDSNDFCCEFNEIFHCKCSHNANPATNCQIANGRERSVAYSWVIWYMSSLDWIGSLHLASLVLISPWQAWHRYNNSVCLLCPFHQSKKPLNNPRSRHNEKSQSMFTAFSCSKTIEKTITVC